MNAVLPIARQWTFAEIAIGQTWQIDRTFIGEDTLRFAEISGDFSPLHVCPADIAGAVAHLLSDEAAFLTGINPVDR